jgi:hypothetical protein
LLYFNSVLWLFVKEMCVSCTEDVRTVNICYTVTVCCGDFQRNCVSVVLKMCGLLTFVIV